MAYPHTNCTGEDPSAAVDDIVVYSDLPRLFMYITSYPHFTDTHAAGTKIV